MKTVPGRSSGGIKLAALLLLIAGYGCASSGWDSSYDSSLYQALREENPEAYAAHARRLQAIIAYAEQRQMRPPPGICLEYAFYLARLQRQQQAQTYLEKELSYYPEAAKFIAVLTRLFQGQKSILEPPPPAIPGK